MPITIQEIIASDTISQLVDKTNFNFDQLLLNGGGPAGPIGPAGPTGPAGGRGPKGTTWYEDTSTSAPGATPIAVPPTSTPLEGDYYLQFNGQVWEYNGTTWVITTIDLQGPTGAAGQDGGFGSYFGQGALLNKNTLLATPVGAGGQGANASNEGVPTILIGGVSSNTSDTGSGIPFTSAYQITDTLATTIASDEISLLIHQKNSSASAIRFMGGGAIASENYSQGPFSEFASLSLAADDGLIFDIPKPATTPSTINDANGFTVTSPNRGMILRMGGNIAIESGSNNNAYGFAGENGNVDITVGSQSGGAGNGNNFNVVTQGTSGSTQFITGAQMTVPATSTQSGFALLDARYIDTVSAADTMIKAGGIATIKAVADANVFAGGNLNLNGDRVIIGEDLNSTGTKGIRLGTTDTNNVEGIKLLAGKPAASSIPTGDGIILKTFGVNEDIRIVAENPGITGGITISSGPGAGNAGYVSIASHGANLNTNSDGGTTVMQVSSKPLVRLQSASGEIVLGGITTGQLSGEVSLYKPMIIMAPNETSTWTPGASVQLPRIQVGASPESPANTAGIAPFYGGAEIRGPYGQPYGAMGANVSINERQGALHIKSGTDTNGKNPGAVYVYTGENTGGSSGSGNYSVNSLRLWASARAMPRPQAPAGSASTAGNRGATGLTLGLNQNKESVTDGGGTVPSPGTEDVTNGANVEGRIYLYGTRNDSRRTEFDIVSNIVSPNTVLDQNTPYPHANGVYNYGGVNVGDQYRGRQQFKVFGDIIGDYYTSEFNGSYSGPSIEQQAIFSGAQTWSTRRTNEGTNNGDEDLAFEYKYQWQRVGRVVTGSGLVRLYVNWDGGSNAGTSIPNGGMFMPSNSEFNSQMKIGPIPLPVQVNLNGGNSQDGAAVSVLRGARAVNISGTVVSKFNFDNSTTNTLDTSRSLSGGAITSYSYTGPFPTGDVRGGTATSSDGMNPNTSTNATHMYLNLLSNFSNSYVVGSTTYHGIYSPIMAFTFSYELNAT
jgi:hypothetical protein